MSNTNLKSQIWTIPNLLSFLRIVLIPVVISVYTRGHYVAAGVILIISAISDSLDGIIARRFNQITALGKVLDPIADKLTQFGVAFCLCFTYTALIPLAVILTFKEIAMGVLGLLMLRQGQEPFGARWWGKAATFLFYVAVILIMLFGNRLPKAAIWAMSLLVVLALAYSLWRYIGMYRTILRRDRRA